MRQARERGMRAGMFILAGMLVLYGCASMGRNVSSTPSAESEAVGETPRQEAGRVAEEDEPLAPIDEEKETVSIITVIETLEMTYRTEDYEKWLSLLTPRYKEKYSKRENLAAEGWDASDLHSFFALLVQARRKENIGSLEISRVEFVSPRKAHVYVIFKGEEFPEPQHTFIRIGDSWYKGLREEED
jgi:hypothetical protein